MKVTVETYYTDSDTYFCKTGKGREILVSLTHFLSDYPSMRLGGYYKVRNDVEVAHGIYYPKQTYQVYELDKTTGKKLRVVPDEL